VLGRALSILTNILAPGLVVLSGEGMRASEHIVPPAREELERRSFGDLRAKLRLVVDHWGDDAWARGAAGLAASRYLTDAVSTHGGDATEPSAGRPARPIPPMRRHES
jgi:predicted NBD/HSP70 family sugar kinase